MVLIEKKEIPNKRAQTEKNWQQLWRVMALQRWNMSGGILICTDGKTIRCSILTYAS